MNKSKKKKKRLFYKYLDELNIDESGLCCVFNSPIEDDKKREKKWKKERKKYGFDSRETWALDFTAATWLYSHLRRFKDVSICVLYGETAHHYLVSVPKEKDGKFLYEIKEDKASVKRAVFEYEEVNLSYGDIIDIILKYLELYINFDDSFEVPAEEGIFINGLAAEAFRLYGIILPSLWW